MTAVSPATGTRNGTEPSAFVSWSTVGALGGPLAVLMIALALRLVVNEHGLKFDELYHVLAARSWATDGTFRIADGEYTRAAPFTMLLGLVIQVLGEHEVVLRLLPTVFGSIWVVVLFVWLRSVTDELTAWIGGLLLALTPEAISLAQYIRFYSLHALVFTVGVVLIYPVIAGRARGLGGLVSVLAAALAFWLALKLQLTTAIGVVAILSFVVLRFLFERWRRQAGWRRPVLELLTLGIAGIAGLAVALQIDAVKELIALFRWTPLWAAGTADSVLFYHWKLTEHFPKLWLLFPVAAAFVIPRRPTFTLFCLISFGVILTLHSLAALKDIRYLNYALVFFLAIWAMALAELLRALVGVLRGLIREAGHGRLADRAAIPVAWAVAVPILLFPAAATDWVQAAPSIAPDRTLAGQVAPDADWPRIAGTVGPIAEQVEAVVVTDELSTLYHLGDYDYLVQPSRLSETAGGHDFAVDGRTGRPVVASVAALQRIQSCHGSGLILGPVRTWRNATFGIDDAGADHVERTMTPVPLPDGSNAFAFRWSNEAPSPPACEPPLHPARS